MKASRIRPWAAAAGVLLLLGTGACTSSKTPPPRASGPSSSAMNVPLGRDGDLVLPPGARGAPRPASTSRTAPGTRQTPPPAAAAQPAALPTGPQVRVIWEALSVERERFENPRFGRRPQAGVANCQRVVLVSQSHPEAQANVTGWQEQNRGVAIAPVPDRDILLFVQGLRQRGFFRLAEPTSTLAHQFQSPNARGRVTVERDGQSWTLLSMRGQGLNPATKQIPRMYSESKQAVMVLRNQVSTMSVVAVQGARLERD